MTGRGLVPPRARWRTAVSVACWVLAAPLLLLELLRLCGLDERASYTVALSTAWPLVTLPALAVVAGAVLVRRPVAGIAGALCLAVVLTAWWPTWFGAVGAGPASGQRLRLLALNVQYTKDTGAAASRQIRAADPDVVVLSELSARSSRDLDLRQYRYRWERPQRTAFGQGVYSRWPLRDISTWTVSGISMVRLTLAAPTGPVRLYQVHTIAPQNAAGRRVWKEQLARLRDMLHGEHQPVIASGDFNASHWNDRFASLLGGAQQLADAGAGRGYLATWPSGDRLLPLVLPLDHVLVSRGIGVRGFHRLGSIGSDHRGVLAELNLGS